MNYKIFFIIILVSLFVFPACDDDLDIQPEQSLSQEGAFENELASNASLMGAYSRLQDLDVFGSMPQIINDFQADNVGFIGSFPTLQAILLNSVLSDNTTISTIFRDHYRAILAANAVIANVPNVNDEGFSDEERAVLIAEAKFIRALTNFNLVNLFAQPYTLDDGASPGIAIVNEPGVLNGDFVLPERSTVAETYNAIIQDLTEALDDLPQVNGRNRASSGAAMALLSRVYLYMNDNGNAADMANSVINNPDYVLASNYDFYDAYTPETIFDVDQSPIDNSRTGSGGWAEFYNPAESGARGDCPYAQELIDSYESGDRRFTELTQFNPDSSLVYTTKYPQLVTNGDNAPVLRVTEMYLNRAEALAKIDGINQESIDLINELRTRAGLTEWSMMDFTEDQEFLDAILQERRLELAFEGHRRLDLLRNGKPLTNSLMPNDLMPGDDQAIMPIPQREIDLGSSLPQNPGY